MDSVKFDSSVWVCYIFAARVQLNNIASSQSVSMLKSTSLDTRTTVFIHCHLVSWVRKDRTTQCIITAVYFTQPE